MEELARGFVKGAFGLSPEDPFPAVGHVASVTLIDVLIPEPSSTLVCTSDIRTLRSSAMMPSSPIASPPCPSMAQKWKKFRQNYWNSMA